MLKKLFLKLVKKRKWKQNYKENLINDLAESKEIQVNFNRIKSIKIVDNKIIATGILTNNELSDILDNFIENEHKENFSRKLS